MVDGLTDLKEKNVENRHCEPCILAKITRLPFNGKMYKARKPLELVHTNVCSVSPSTWDGYKHFVTFIDDFTHFTAVYLLRDKSEVFEYFKTYYNYASNHISRNFKSFCDEKGIVLQYTAAYNPEMNGVAERMNRTLTEKARALLLDSQLPKELWGEALRYTVYVTNRSPTASLNVTPFEMWEERRPNVSNFRIFGSSAYAHIPQKLRMKLDPRGVKLKMVGYAPGGYRLWDANERKIRIERNVLFREETCSESPETISIDVESISDGKEKDDVSSPEKILTSDNNLESLQPEGRDTDNVNSREKRKKTKPKYLQDFVTDDSDLGDILMASFLSCSNGNVPEKYNDIDSYHDKDRWYEAVNEEIKSLEDNKTWEVVERSNDAKLIDCRWIFTKKAGNVYKARLVARGFQQEDSFTQIYSPVLKLETLRVLLSLAVQRNYLIHQMDVKGAFLHGEIDDVVYLKPWCKYKYKLCLEIEKNHFRVLKNL
ncbi:unnamed protein product [Parnassius mnemosyne]|uniref:Integrase catalytic domain-containing protein n=1 Tax=Parnassius mnemosyne TaxID=213953 RepID=A0AAV1LT20_9NEOP